MATSKPKPTPTTKGKVTVKNTDLPSKVEESKTVVIVPVNEPTRDKGDGGNDTPPFVVFFVASVIIATIIMFIIFGGDNETGVKKKKRKRKH